MKYRMPTELIDLVEVASTQKVGLTRHSTPNYDIDEVAKYVAGAFKEDQYKINDYNQVTGNQGPHEVYRVFQLRFTDVGDVTLFGDHLKVEKDYVIIRASEYEELTKKPEEPVETAVEEKSADEPKKIDDVVIEDISDEPINLDDIPF